MLNIPFTYGGQDVTFVAVDDTGLPGYLGVKDKAPTETVVSGCRFRPFNVMETPDAETDVATGIWKCTAPPVPAALNAKSSDEVKVDGVTYQIDGPVQPKRDMAGALHHVTIMCKRQVG